MLPSESGVGFFTRRPSTNVPFVLVEILDRPALAIRRDAQVRPRERAVGM